MRTERSGYGFALLAYAFAAIMLGTTMPSPMYALYSEHLHFAVVETTVIYATYAGGVLTALLVFGSWSDAIGRRPVLLAGTSAAAQILAVRIAPRRAVALGCAILIVGMVVLAVALHFSSLPALIAASLVSGLGQGISFSRGLAAVAEGTPAEVRAAVNSAYFVVAYVAISMPVVGAGLAAQAWGLRASGTVFALAVGVLAAACLVAIVRQQSRTCESKTVV